MRLKGSNIQGVNTIPSRWQIKELKYCLLPGSEGIKIGPFGSALKSEMLVDEGYKVYGQENLIKDNFNLGQRFISEEKFKELKVYEIAEKDVLISMMGTVGKCKVVPANIQKGIMDSHLIRVRFNENIILPEFATYLIQDSNYIKVQLDLNSKGSIMSGLNSSIIKKLKLILPPIEEQKIILKYMDKRNVDLNQIIASKSYMIDLLNQQRQSIIMEAVTKGLNPKVKMKDSGVEWVNEIPEHWTQKKIKYLVDRVSRDVRDEDEVITAFRDGQVTLRKNRREDGFTFSIKEIGYQGIRKGDLVVHQMDAFAGAIGVSESDGKASPVYTVCIPKNKKEIHVPFLCEVIRVMSNSGYIESLAKGIRERSTDFRWKDMGELASLVPPISEQIEIANTISRKSQEIKMLIQLMKKDIEKLKEYRQALIYEAVTGKIDVRDMELD